MLRSRTIFSLVPSLTSSCSFSNFLVFVIFITFSQMMFHVALDIATRAHESARGASAYLEGVGVLFAITFAITASLVVGRISQLAERRKTYEEISRMIATATLQEAKSGEGSPGHKGPSQYGNLKLRLTHQERKRFIQSASITAAAILLASATIQYLEESLQADPSSLWFPSLPGNGVYGILIGLLVAFLDRKVRREERQETRHREAVDGSSSAIAILQNRRIVYANKALSLVTNLSSKEMIGREPRFIRPLDRAWKEIERSITEPGAYFDIEIAARGGQQVRCKAFVSPISFRGARALGIITNVKR